MAGYNTADGQVDPEDNPEVHFDDICRAAARICDQRLAKILAYEALQTIPYLEKLGVKFEKDGDRYLEVIGCFASRPRMHIIKRHSEPIIAALKKEIEACLENLESIKGVLSSDILIEEYTDLLAALEIQDMIDTARIMVKAALYRKESRGSHYREDYPVKDDENFSKSIITKRVEGQVTQYLEKLPTFS